VAKQILGMRSTATSAMGGFDSNRGKVVRERKIRAEALEELIHYVRSHQPENLVQSPIDKTIKLQCAIDKNILNSVYKTKLQTKVVH
jgi:hypothetical protein